MPRGKKLGSVSLYNLTVKVLGKLHTSNGKTLEEAIEKLKIRNAKGMSVWTVEKGGVKREKIIPASVTFRLFNSSGFSKDVARKQFNTLIGL